MHARNTTLKSAEKEKKVRKSNMNKSESAEGEEKWSSNHNLVATKLKKDVIKALKKWSNCGASSYLLLRLLEGRADILVKIMVTPLFLIYSWRNIFIRQIRQDVMVMKSERFFGWIEAQVLSVWSRWWVFVVKDRGEIFTDVWRTKTHPLRRVFIAYVDHTTFKSVAGLLLFFDWGHHVSVVKRFTNTPLACFELITIWVHICMTYVMVTCHFLVARNIIPSLCILGKSCVIWLSRWFWLHFHNLMLITKWKGLTFILLFSAKKVEDKVAQNWWAKTFILKYSTLTLLTLWARGFL